MSEYYFSKLNSKEQNCYHKLIEAIRNNETSVRMGFCINDDALTQIVNAVNFDHPEFFYVDFQSVKYTFSPIGTTYYIHYTVRTAMREFAMQNMEAWVDLVLSGLNIKKLEASLSICRKIHNYLVNHVEYNYDALQNPESFPEAFSVGGVFEQNKAVCEGISKAFMLLCERAGVETHILSGISSCEGFGDSLPHAWNIVKIGKDYAHVDVTWDLGISATSKFMRYDYFMIPDDWIVTDHVFESDIKCYFSQNTFFAKTGCLFDGVKSLKAYLDRELRKKTNILYFKIVGKNEMPNDIISRVQNMVQKMISQYIFETYSIRMVHNVEQKIFFFKIEGRR